MPLPLPTAAVRLGLVPSLWWLRREYGSPVFRTRPTSWMAALRRFLEPSGRPGPGAWWVSAHRTATGTFCGGFESPGGRGRV